MASSRHFSAALAAAALVLGALFTLLFSATGSNAQTAAGCEETAQVAVLPVPISPWTGVPLRVLVVAEKPLRGELSLIGPDGNVAAKSTGRQGGPPYFWIAEVASPPAGTWHASLALDDGPAGCSAITRDITVGDSASPAERGSSTSVWPIRNSWNRATENLYSAWIQKLFDAPVDQELSWPTLTQVLRDRSRNILFNYLGLGEDEMGIIYHPDCAKFPYFLRAYFAFKLGLPFGYSHCSRGKEGSAPRCGNWGNIANAGGGQGGLAASFRRFLPVLGDAVQSGNGRTAANDNNTDFYPVPLTQDALRPGTIYADPYGHILMLVRRVPQAGGQAGLLFAADAEPDGSVTRKRFWRGNFLFVHNPALGSPGFKHFRPVVRTANGSLRRLTNEEIAKDPQFGDFSLEQSKLGMEEFYDRMDEVISPEPLDPMRAMEDAIASLEEQVKTRVTAVENGRKYQSGHGDADMPDGASIFETSGAWEDFATPARDFRMLIAIDVVTGFPDHVASHPNRYAMPDGKSVDEVKAELQSMLASELASRKFTYTRSDGSQWTLSLKDVIDRAADFEMGYNLNDCVELRWGAPEGSSEASTCERHAPAVQRAKMSEYRNWFRERHWPTHA